MTLPTDRSPIERNPLFQDDRVFGEDEGGSRLSEKTTGTFGRMLGLKFQAGPSAHGFQHEMF